MRNWLALLAHVAILTGTLYIIVQMYRKRNGPERLVLLLVYTVLAVVVIAGVVSIPSSIALVVSTGAVGVATAITLYYLHRSH